MPWSSSGGSALRGRRRVAKDAEKPWYGNLKFRSVGPAIGGRVARVSGVAGDPLTWWMATAQGGVWKSSDGGVKFEPVFDDQPTSSIGSIAVAPSDPNVVYVGSGEANIRGNVSPGNGIYKSTDAGKSWRHVWEQVGQIGTMVVHPTDPDVAYAAVLGHAFGPNPERGVYRTEDGGATWKRVLFVDDKTGASDVALDPANPRILFAGTWQARRRPWTLESGGPGGGLWRSRDGGDTWERLTGKGLPEGDWGKVGVRVAPSDSRRVYALDRSRRRAASTAPTTAATPGSSRAATMRSASAPGTTPCSPSIRGTPTSSGSPRSTCCARSTAARPSTPSTASPTATTTTSGSIPSIPAA